jgi:hypothetical protein
MDGAHVCWPFSTTGTWLSPKAIQGVSSLQGHRVSLHQITCILGPVIVQQVYTASRVCSFPPGLFLRKADGGPGFVSFAIEAVWSQMPLNWGPQDRGQGQTCAPRRGRLHLLSLHVGSARLQQQGLFQGPW